MCHFQEEGVKYLSIFLPLVATVGLYVEAGRAKVLGFLCLPLGGESPSNIHIRLRVRGQRLLQYSYFEVICDCREPTLTNTGNL